MNVVEIASIVASFVSMALAGFAIWLALYLYNESKHTEGHVKEALASIKSQTDTLQRLTGKMIERLTAAVTSPRPADEAFVLLMATIRDMPTAIVANLRSPAPDASQQALLAELLNAYIVLYYYAGVANMASQAYLPTLEELGEQDPIQRIVDQSASDFGILEGMITQVDEALLRASRVHHLFVEASTQWKPHIKDSVAVYRERQAGA